MHFDVLDFQPLSPHLTHVKHVEYLNTDGSLTSLDLGLYSYGPTWHKNKLLLKRLG